MNSKTVTKIVLNTTSTADDIGHNLKRFLDYVDGKPVSDDYTKKLEEAVKIARANKEWRREYMTLMMRDLENQEKGRKEGQKDTAGLMGFLAKTGRTEDIVRASTDESYLDKLLAEFKTKQLA